MGVWDTKKTGKQENRRDTVLLLGKFYGCQTPQSGHSYQKNNTGGEALFFSILKKFKDGLP